MAEIKAKFVPGPTKGRAHLGTDPEVLFNTAVDIDRLGRSGVIENPTDAINHANLLLDIAIFLATLGAVNKFK